MSCFVQGGLARRYFWSVSAGHLAPPAPGAALHSAAAARGAACPSLRWAVHVPSAREGAEGRSANCEQSMGEGGGVVLVWIP